VPSSFKEGIQSDNFIRNIERLEGIGACARGLHIRDDRAEEVCAIA